MSTILRYDDGLWPNTLAIGFSLTGYGLGVWLLTLESWVLNALGVLVLAQSLIYAAYLIHEFAGNAMPTDSGLSSSPASDEKRRTLSMVSTSARSAAKRLASPAS